MIVFWQETTRRHWSQPLANWRCYAGRAKLRNGAMHIYPTKGTRKKLHQFIAFDDDHQPPRLISSFGQMGGNVDMLPCVGAVAKHLPHLYCDEYGNIRRMASDLPLVWSGPNWDAVKEDEFQTAIAVPF